METQFILRYRFVWAIPRTSHWTGAALEQSGFIVRDVLTHIYGSGFPKSIAIDKAIERAKYTNTDELFKVTAWIRNRRDELGLRNKDLDDIAECTGGACHWTALPPYGQPHIPTKERWDKLEVALGIPPEWLSNLIKPAVVNSFSQNSNEVKSSDVEFPSSQNIEQSRKWQGWGTALKPASEHWILVQKPISEHNIAANILKHGVGGINIDASRIPVSGKIPSTANLSFQDSGSLWNVGRRSKTSIYHQHPNGRFPGNVVLTRTDNVSCPAKIMSDQSERELEVSQYFKNFKLEVPFLYCKKPHKKEKGHDNTHPTVKPLRLMRYLCKLVTPSDGTVIDPFMGSGTTGVAALFEKFKFIGIEQNEIYFEIANKRLKGVRE